MANKRKQAVTLNHTTAQRLQACYEKWIRRLEAAPDTQPAQRSNKNRYQTDEEFREYRKKMSREYYHKRKQRKAQQDENKQGD
jgi:hypothetical protein